MDSESEVHVRVVAAPDVARVVRRLRAASDLPIAALARAVREGAPIRVAVLYGLDHDDVEASVRSLLADLAALGARFETVCGAETVEKSVLLNYFDRWRQIRRDTRMESDLESSAPGEEALEWSRRGGGFERG